MSYEIWEFILFNDDIHGIGLSIVIFLLFVLFRKIFAKYLFSLLVKLAKKAPGDFFTSVFEAFKKPLEWLFIVIGIYIAAHYFPYFNHENLLFLDIIRASIIVLITWGLFNLAGESSVLVRPSLSTLIILLMRGSVPSFVLIPAASAKLTAAPVAKMTYFASYSLVSL